MNILMLYDIISEQVNYDGNLIDSCFKCSSFKFKLLNSFLTGSHDSIVYMGIYIGLHFYEKTKVSNIFSLTYTTEVTI
jgi:hypothetical protein